MGQGDMSKSDAGKGDTPRKVNGDKYRENYNRIFGKKNDRPNPQSNS